MVVCPLWQWQWHGDPQHLLPDPPFLSASAPRYADFLQLRGHTKASIAAMTDGDLKKLAIPDYDRHKIKLRLQLDVLLKEDLRHLELSSCPLDSNDSHRPGSIGGIPGVDGIIPGVDGIVSIGRSHRSESSPSSSWGLFGRSGTSGVSGGSSSPAYPSPPSTSSSLFTTSLLRQSETVPGAMAGGVAEMVLETAKVGPPGFGYEGVVGNVQQQQQQHHHHEQQQQQQQSYCHQQEQWCWQQEPQEQQEQQQQAQAPRWTTSCMKKLE